MAIRPVFSNYSKVFGVWIIECVWQLPDKPFKHDLTGKKIYQNYFSAHTPYIYDRKDSAKISTLGW